MGKFYEGHHFFILSKGHNAGRPLEKPCPNCFVLLAKSGEEKQKLYWLCFGLWQLGIFKKFLTGSVIPFIRLEDFKTVLKKSFEETTETELQKSMAAVKQLQRHQENIMRQLDLIKQAKKSLLYKVIR